MGMSDTRLFLEGLDMMRFWIRISNELYHGIKGLDMIGLYIIIDYEWLRW